MLEPVTETPPARNLAADGLDMARVRSQIHAGRKIALCYRDEQGRESERIVWPVTVGYLETVRHLIAWCELRQDFRSFRTDRVTAAGFLDERYPGAAERAAGEMATDAECAQAAKCPAEPRADPSTSGRRAVQKNCLHRMIANR